MKRVMIIMILLFIAITSARAATPSFDNLPLGQAPLRFAIIGDRTSEANPGVYEEIVAEVENMKPDFVITVGDAIQGYTNDTLKLNSEWDEYFSIVKPLTIPIYLTPGNHDITNEVELGSYQHRVGKPYYSFDVRDYHFIVLDVTRWESSEELPSEELAWLAKDLDEHKNAAQTLVFYHKPFWYDSIVMGKPDTLHALFIKGGVDAVFNGHFHTYFSSKIDGILYTAVGSSGGITDALPTDLKFHFTWVTIDDNGISIAPVKIGSVKAWDIVTAAEEHAVDNTVQFGMKFSTKAPVSDNLKVVDGMATLEINNVTSNILNDTIRWETPIGWSIEPAAEHVTVNPGEIKEVSFKIKSVGSLYPVPTVSVRFPYSNGKTIPIVKELKISRTATAYPAKTAPVIDGKLDESIWHDPSAQLFSPDGGAVKAESTWFYFAYDRENLYLAVHCRESKMDELRASAKKRDGGVSSDDCVGFFLQPNPQVDTAYQIYFNPIGTTLDQRIARGLLGYFNGEKSWNGDYVVKTKKGKDYWNMEARIPLSRLGVSAPAQGQSWGLNFLRKQRRLNTSANWQIPIDFDPQTFATLTFK
ncbi:MAG TPA: hypothetical protein DCZ43_12670 [candidate division Zixibacteria bacterium]|nr:hypothetical protein [candidate division Zixibacteria bacterium]